MARQTHGAQLVEVSRKFRRAVRQASQAKQKILSREIGGSTPGRFTETNPKKTNFGKALRSVSGSRPARARALSLCACGGAYRRH